MGLSFFSRPSPPTPPPSPPPRPPPPHVCSLVTSLSSCSSSSSSSASFSSSSSCFLVVALMLLLSLQWKALRGQGAAFLAALYCSSFSFASCSCMFAGDALACTSAMFVLLRAGLLMSRSKAGSCGRSGACRFVKEKVAAIFNRGLYDMNIRILMRDIVGGPYHPPLWRCHSTDAKQAKSDRGAPYIYWGYSRWAAFASTIVAFCRSTEAKQAVMTGQLIAVVLCTHGQRAVE